MFEDFEELIDTVNAYLTGETNIDPDELAVDVTCFLRQKEPKERYPLAMQVRALLCRQRDANREARRQAFKDAIMAYEKRYPWHSPTEKRCNWVSILLGSHLIDRHSLFFRATTYDNTAEKPLSFPSERFEEITEPALGAIPASAVVSGSNFVTSQPQKLYAGESHILDALHVSCVLHPQNASLIQGVVVALADGSGGHWRVTPESFSNPQLSPEARLEKAEEQNRDLARQDRMIARASHFATKYAVKLFATLDHPDKLVYEIPDIIDRISQLIKVKAPCESTTLLCARVFPADHGYRVVGFNIGDGLLAMWDPADKRFLTLLPAHETLPGPMQEATALLPDSHRDFELHHIDQHIPPTAILLPFSDGYIDLLPTKSECRVYPNGLAYRETVLDEQRMRDLLAPVSMREDAEPRDYLQAITDYVVRQTEIKRQSELAQGHEIQLGDDMMAAAIPLPSLTLPCQERPRSTCSLM